MDPRERLSPAKRALFERWLRQGASGPAGIPLRRPDAGPPPLSFVQEGQLFLELLAPGTPVNHLVACMEMTGALDEQVLRESANAIVARHETLRTRFDMGGGRRRPRVVDQVVLELPVVDLRQERALALDRALEAARTEAARPFDLSRAPLLRVRLYRLAPQRHVFLLVIHHTIADGWSLGVFLGELASQYGARLHGGPPALAPLPIQYGDYAHWQRGLAAGPAMERHVVFWKETLAGELPLLDLPLDKRRPARQSWAGRTHRFPLPGSLVRRLRELSSAHDATPFMTLAAAFQAFLHRYTGQDEILLGTPTAGRTRPQLQGMIGVFINTLVLRTDLSGDPSFLQLLARVRKAALDAYAHAEAPFERMLPELRPPRDLSRTPVFQAVFIMQNTPTSPTPMPGLDTRPLFVDRGAAQFDLTLIVEESGEELEASLEYASGLFEPATVASWADAFVHLLGDAVARPETHVAKLRIMDGSERQRLLTAQNDTAFDLPRELPFHALVCEQARRTPDAVAVVCGGEVLSYGELVAWADAVAAELGNRGVRPGERVAICLDRGPALVAGLLAVGTAGGAYVPLDPSYPAERVAHILRDADVRFMLVEPSADHTHAAETVVLERGKAARPGPTSRNGAAHARGSDAEGEAPAYVIYTSGSTGRPKGVVVSHHALTNLLWGMRVQLDVKSTDTMLAVSSITFDIASMDMFLPLICGARLVIATEEIVRDGHALQDALNRHDVSLMQATPATWRLLLAGGWAGKPDLVAVSGGEALPPELAGQLLERVGVLWNVYGPTETTIWSTAAQVASAEAPIPIGRPIANTRLYVLDGALQPAPVGATGELHIAGAGVALGYLGRPDLTAEKFLPDPFAPSGGRPARMFKTGDRARYEADGSVRLLGRRDHQVKVNGFRIELGEVEAALRRHPSIREAVALRTETALGGGRLEAVVVPNQGPAPSAVEMRAFLGGILPACMVPAVIAVTSELPLTTAGKIDRGSLASARRVQEDRALVAPTTTRERVLADLFAQVLGQERVGVNDSFFDLGGGSIQILETIARARRFGIDLLPEDFFLEPTVAGLVSRLSSQGGTRESIDA